MIAIVDLPLRGTNTITGHDVLVIALALARQEVGNTAAENFLVVYVDQDGSLGQARLDEVNINWRFNDRTRKWVDVDTGEEIEEADGQSTD